jgi:hypothetical protein
VVIGRWWALLASVAVGVWIGVVEDLEVPGWFIGGAYALLAGGGIAAGVLTRRFARR